MEDMKNMRDKFFFVGVAVIIGLLLVSICSNISCDSCHEEEEIDEAQAYEQEILTEYEEEKASFEKEIQEIDKEMQRLQEELSAKKNEIIQAEQVAKQKIYENREKTSTHKDKKEKKSERKERNIESQEKSQYNAHSFSLINGELQGTFSSSDKEKIAEYKKALGKYATIIKEDDQSFSFTTSKEKNWKNILEIGSSF